MATLYSYLFLFAIFIIHSSSICFVQCTGNISTDLSVLLSLKAQLTLHDPNNILATNWSTATSICHWVGVHCDSQHHRVVALDISNMSLLGKFPTSLVNLSFLSFLNMSNNNFIGEIPQQLGNLRNLKVIDTHRNHLTGAIPNSIFNISALEHIDFSNNSLSSILPPNICHQLPNLKVLCLYLNGFNGPIPANLSACSKLRALSLSYNMFDGLIPKELGKLEMLQKLIIGGNNLTGTIPNELGNLHNLKTFAAEGNQIIGYIPKFISNMSSFQILSLSTNKLMGSIPREIGNLSSLQSLMLYENYFTEYGSEGIVSTKCDVYSYGILLMETFTRTKPSNEIFSENLSLKIWVKNSMPNRVIDIIDANLLAQDEEPSSEKIKCFSCIMELALSCCLESPAERMCMKEVVAALQKIKRQLACSI